MSRCFFFGVAVLTFFTGGFADIIIEEDFPDGVVSGSDVLLTCKADPEVNLVWAFNMGPLEITDRHVITDATDPETAQQVYTLTIKQMTSQDEGTYRCVNKDNYWDRADLHVSVKQPKMQETGSVTIEGARRVSVHAGDKVMLVCTGSGRQLGWVLPRYHVKSTTQTPDQITWTTSEIRGRSVITNQAVDVSQGGRYVCNDVTNKNERASVHLNVIDTPRDRSNTASEVTTQQEAKHATVKITYPDKQDMYISEGSNFSLRCKSHKDTRLVWTRDGQPLTSRLWLTITEAVNLFTATRGSLLVNLKFTQHDAGRYACVNADQSQDRDEIEVYLKPDQREGIKMVEPSGERLHLQIGDHLRLRCTADTSTAKIRWRHNGQPVTSSLWRMVHVMSAFGYSMVTKAAVDESDAGEYECYEEGRSDSRASVDVTVQSPQTGNEAIGCADLDLSAPKVAFSAVASEVQQPPRSAELVTMDTVITNLGCALDINGTSTKSRFIAPIKGLYMFYMMSTSHDKDDGAVPLALYRNAQEVMTSSLAQSAADAPPSGQNSVVLALEGGDVISLKMKGNERGFFGSLVGYFSSQPSSQVSFSGYLIST